MASHQEATSGGDREFDHDAETVLVTGATGDVGSWVVDRLADRDVEVVGIDLERPDGTRANASFRTVDLREQASTWESIREIDPDAVVHCAGIADPFENPSTRVFENNTMCTYNVLVAAGREGVDDVVWTSSQASYGPLLADDEWVPDALPVDERHDRRPADPYGLSKRCGEEIADAVAREYDASVTTIQPATIFSPDDHRARPPRETDDLSADAGGNFGSYVDVRDVARLVEAALATEVEGHETVLCVADENYLGRPTTELVEAVCGDLPERCEIEGRQAALSNAKAQRLFGWTPAYDRRDLEEEATGPDWR